MKTFKLFIAILLLCSGHCANAQQKGSFNATLSFMNENRTLSCFVPANYDSTQQYDLLVCLHGLGDNSNNYRSAIVNALGWPLIFTNTIIICPDGGEDANSDFYMPKGDQGIIESSIRYAIENYSIDSNNILLQGFSLGGRSALKYGLEHHERFNGLLLNTPAMQGIQDVENNPLASLDYDYENASLIPVYITVGEDDDLYEASVKNMVEKLKRNNGIVDFTAVAGLGHTIPTKPTTLKAAAFLNNPYKADYDLEVFAIDARDRYCSDIQAKCLVRNTGNATVNSIKLNINYGNVSTTHTWNGSLAAYKYAEINLPAISAANGMAPLTVTIAGVNTSDVDPNHANDSFAKTIEVAKEPISTLIEEGFDDENPFWITSDVDNLFNWYLDTDVKKSGTASLAAFNTPLLFYTTGSVVDMLSPVFDLSSKTAPTLSFDLAFNYFHYTPPYVSTPWDYADTLEILITTDCGETFQRIYKKGGAELATATDPIENPLSIQACFFTPEANEWRKEIIDLTPYIGNASAYVKFNYISAMGGSIFIDNARIGEGLPSALEEKQPTLAFEMYPNPVSETLNLTITEPDHTKIKIYDSLGKTMVNEYSNNNAESRFAINLNELSNGFYIVEITNGSEKVSKKLLINK